MSSINTLKQAFYREWQNLKIYLVGKKIFEAVENNEEKVVNVPIKKYFQKQKRSSENSLIKKGLEFKLLFSQNSFLEKKACISEFTSLVKRLKQYVASHDQIKQVQKISKFYFKEKEGWSCFTGQRAFKELLKIYNFLINYPDCSDVFVINLIRNDNYRFCYISNGVTMYVSCKAEGLSLDQWNRVYELSKKFKPTTRVKTLEGKTSDATELRLQVKETLVRTLEEYQNYVAKKKKNPDKIARMKKRQNQDVMMKKVKRQDNMMEDIKHQVVMTENIQNQDETMKEIQDSDEQTMEEGQNLDSTMDEAQNQDGTME